MAGNKNFKSTYIPPYRPIPPPPPATNTGPKLSMQMLQGHGQWMVGRMEQRLVMTPRVKDEVDEEEILARTVLPCPQDEE